MLARTILPAGKLCAQHTAHLAAAVQEQLRTRAERGAQRWHRTAKLHHAHRQMHAQPQLGSRVRAGKRALGHCPCKLQWGTTDAALLDASARAGLGSLESACARSKAARRVSAGAPGSEQVEILFFLKFMMPGWHVALLTRFAPADPSPSDSEPVAWPVGRSAPRV